MALISGRMTYSFFYVTAFLIGPLLGMLSYSIGGEEAGSWENLLLYHEEPVGSREPGHPGVPGPASFWA